MIKEIICVVNKCIFIIVGIGVNLMCEVIELIKEVKEFGVDVVFLVIFYYNELI